MPTAGDIAAFLGDGVEPLVETWRERTITGPAGLVSASEGTLSFVKVPGARVVERLGASAPSMLIVPRDATVDAELLRDRGVECVIRVENPRLAFARVVAALFPRTLPVGIDPTAVISPDARIGDDVSIGAHAFIGAVEIGDGSEIHPGVCIYDGASIGRRVRIFANAVIGADGFGFERDEAGVPVKFPQLGGVVIEDDVEIGAGTCVDRGALSNTLIERNAKIDNMVHIAHNVVVGTGSIIAANAVIAGSTVLGPRVWVGPSACVSNRLVVGADASVSLGSVVTRDVPEGSRVTGNFAVDHAQFLGNLRKNRG